MNLMKKINFTIIVSILLILSTVFLGNKYVADIPIVTINSPATETVNNTVVCSGAIEYGKTYTTSSASKGVISECYVSAGDKVSKGDPLFSVVANNSETTDIDSAQVYSAISSGNYDILDEYNKYLENGQLSASNSTAQITDNTQPKKILAAENGIITDLECSEGEQVKAGEPIATIASDNNLQVRLPISEDNINKVKVGQSVIISGTAFPNTEFTGSVISIDETAKLSTTVSGKQTTVDVLVSIEDPTEMLKSGYTAKCSIVTEVKDNTLIIPYDSLLCEDNGKEYVYIYNDGKAIKKYITTGEEYSQGYEVLKGLSTQDKVVANPDQITHNSQTIKLKESLV